MQYLGDHPDEIQAGATAWRAAMQEVVARAFHARANPNPARAREAVLDALDDLQPSLEQLRREVAERQPVFLRETARLRFARRTPDEMLKGLFWDETAAGVAQRIVDQQIQVPLQVIGESVIAEGTTLFPDWVKTPANFLAWHSGWMVRMRDDKLRRVDLPSFAKPIGAVEFVEDQKRRHGGILGPALSDRESQAWSDLEVVVEAYEQLVEDYDRANKTDLLRRDPKFDPWTAGHLEIAPPTLS